MIPQPSLFKVPAGDGATQWALTDVRTPGGVLAMNASGWVDIGRGVGRIETRSADESARQLLLAELGRQYPGVRWFTDRVPASGEQ